jgi:hypothetical protein
MIFKVAGANAFYDNYSYFNRLESETGRWTFAYFPVMYGIRIHISLTNSKFLACDICCGSNQANIALITLVLLLWLKGLNEEITTRELEAAFPRFKLKPVTSNPEWQDFMSQVLDNPEVYLCS